ncbi:MAG TPA: peptide chain release factor 1 [Nitriliruptoraceae bacterium]|nr:peptide chain release factor 1 [Nitriliruptoraceae bacterium]
MQDELVQRLAAARLRLRDVEAHLGDPAADPADFADLGREHAELSAVVAAADRAAEAVDTAAEARELARDASGEERTMWVAEAERADRDAVAAEAELAGLLAPTDPNDGRDVIIEIRSAAGGDEAGLFAGELRDMYVRYAQRQGWTTETVTENAQGIGGIRDATFEVSGPDAWAHLKHESGVHRVQRVPVTESGGRIHTSTASVAVLPAAEDVDVDIAPGDLRVDVYRSSGPGGQSVNTTDSAVRITHVPTGVVVTSQDQKSQHQNRDKALRVLRSRLLAAEQERAASDRADARRDQIGTGDRSEKIRTYNFPQTRVTDHRINLTVHNLADVLGGDLDEIVAALREVERAQQLAGD